MPGLAKNSSILCMDTLLVLTKLHTDSIYVNLMYVFVYAYAFSHYDLLSLS